MLAKLERLKERHLLNAAFKKKQRLGSSILVLYYLTKKNDNNNQALPKVAFTVSTKVEKKANKRNLIKRRMRAAYQLIKKKLIGLNKNKFCNNLVFIWIASPSIKNATFEQIKASMENLLIKL